MTDKTNKFFFNQLNRYEQCLANGFSGAMGNRLAGTIKYPYDQASFERHSAIFRDFTLALYGIHGIEAQISATAPLIKEVRNLCLAIAGNDPLSLLPTPPKIPSTPAAQRQSF